MSNPRNKDRKLIQINTEKNLFISFKNIKIKNKTKKKLILSRSILILVLVSIFCFTGIVANELTMSAIDSAYVTDLSPADEKNYGVDEVYIAANFDETASETGNRRYQSDIAFYFDSNALPSSSKIKNVYFEATARTCGAENYFKTDEGEYMLAQEYIGEDKKCGLHKVRVLLDKDNIMKAKENANDKEHFAIVIQVKPNGSTMYFGANNENVEYIPRMVVEMSQELSDIEVKVSGPSEVPQGSSSNFRAAISNLGSTADDSVSFNLRFPDGVSLSNIETMSPFSCDELPCSLPELSPSETLTLDVGFTVASMAPLGETEIAAIAETQEEDMNPDNNIDFLIFNITEPVNQTDQCLNLTTCDACVAQETCGWCADTEECIPVADFNEIDECDVFYLDSCEECDVPQLFQEHGEMNHPPEPQVKIHYDRGDHKFHFTVDAAYLRDRSSYFIDFVQFNYPSNGEYEVTNCENREPNWKQSDIEDFHKQWLSAAHAQQPGALGTSQFKAYGPSGIWNLRSMSCNQIQYSTALSLSDILTCQNREGSPSISFNHIPGTSIAELSGALYVSIAVPVDHAMGPSEGFTVFEYRHPFTYQFNLELSHTVSISSLSRNENPQNFISLDPIIESYGINKHNLLELNLKTRLEGAEGAHLSSPSVLSMIPVSVSTKPKLECQAPCEQEWTITSEQALQDYIDDYQVKWKITNCNAQGECEDSGRTAKLKLSLALSQPIQQTGKDSFEAQVGVYDSLESTNTNQGPYNKGDFVFLKKELVLNKTQEDSYHLMIENVWLCYPATSSYTPMWDPENDHYGCSQAHGKELPESNIIQIIKEGSPERKGKAAAFEAQIHSPKDGVLPHWSTSGVSMKAQPMTKNDRTYMVHIESTIVPRYDNTATGWKSITLLRSDNALTMISIKGSGEDEGETNQQPAAGSWATHSSQLSSLVILIVITIISSILL